MTDPPELEAAEDHTDINSQGGVVLHFYCCYLDATFGAYGVCTKVQTPVYGTARPGKVEDRGRQGSRAWPTAQIRAVHGSGGGGRASGWGSARCIGRPLAERSVWVEDSTAT